MLAIRAHRDFVPPRRRAVRRRSGRRLTGLCLVWCYIVGTVGLPLPGVGGSCRSPSGGGEVCRCSVASVLAGTCCCRSHAARRTCCEARAAAPAARSVPHEITKSAVPRTCCSSRNAASDGKGQDSSRNELRVSGCPCGPGAPDAGFICVDPRLPPSAISLTIDFRVVSHLPITSASAPSGTLEPQTPPPRS